MPRPTQPDVVLSATLDPTETEALLRIVHGPAGTAFRDAESAGTGIQQQIIATDSVHREHTQLLVGEFSVILDSKSRFSVPSVMRDSFDHGESYLTVTSEAYLLLFPGTEFKRIFSELQAAVTLSPTAVALKTYFTAHSYSVVPDGQRRITVPPPLRRFLISSEANTPAHLVLSGSGNFVEVWAGDKWVKHIEGGKKEG